MNLKQIYKLFPTETNCIDHLEKVRWDNKPCCPYCGSGNNSSVGRERRYHCNTCNTSFSVTVRTVFHRTHVPLQKWFLAIFLILTSNNKNSARQLSNWLRINKDTAWRITSKIEEAMRDKEHRDLIIALKDNLEINKMRFNKKENMWDPNKN